MVCLQASNPTHDLTSSSDMMKRFPVHTGIKLNYMPVLHNRISQAELKKLLYAETVHRTTISFYQYFKIDDPKLFRDEMYTALTPLKVFGRIYVAAEGINAQVSVPDDYVEAFTKYLYSNPMLKGIRLNIAADDDARLPAPAGTAGNNKAGQGRSFWVLKIKVREKIVADGIHDPGFSMQHKGRYVNAVEMNELMQDDNTIVIDMRNHYEYEVGHFVRAVEIPSDTFREQLPMAVDMMKDKKNKNIIMYCTGGIRCEKASAYMRHHGFNNVFHLEGGIINYARQAKEKGLENKFIGKNFVFDDRLGERITEDVIAKCHQCGQPADTHTNCKNNGCHLLFIQCMDCEKKYNGCCCEACQSIHNLPVEDQKELRKGIDKGMMVFNKSRHRVRPGLNEM